MSKSISKGLCLLVACLMISQALANGVQSILPDLSVCHSKERLPQTAIQYAFTAGTGGDFLADNYSRTAEI